MGCRNRSVHFHLIAHQKFKNGKRRRQIVGAIPLHSLPGFSNSKLNTNQSELLLFLLVSEVLIQVHLADGAVYAAFQPLAYTAGPMEDVSARQLRYYLVLLVRLLTDRTALRRLANLHLLYLVSIVLWKATFRLRFHSSVGLRPELRNIVVDGATFDCRHCGCCYFLSRR